MTKILVLLGIFICSVYSDEEKTNKSVISQQQTGLRVLRDNFKSQFEKQDEAACEENNYEKSEFSELSALPVSTKNYPVMTVTTDNNFVPEIVNGVNYNSRRSIPNINLSVDSSLLYKASDDYITETNKKIEKVESLPVNKKYIGINEIPSNINTANPEYLCADDTNKNANQQNNGGIGNIEGLPHTRRIIPGIIKNGTTEELKYNKLIFIEPESNQNERDIDHLKNVPATRRLLQDNIKNPTYQELNHPDGDVQSEIDERRGTISNVDKPANANNKMTENELLTQKYIPVEDSIEGRLMEPTKGKGISNMKDTNVMLLENSRVCYACSTVNDPSCWAPTRETSVKYCQKGHSSCLTKSFKYKDTSFIIRDCGSYCVNPNGDRYSSCSICHSDLCNSASTITLYNTGIVLTVFLFGIFFNKN